MVRPLQLLHAKRTGLQNQREIRRQVHAPPNQNLQCGSDERDSQLRLDQERRTAVHQSGHNIQHEQQLEDPGALGPRLVRDAMEHDRSDCWLRQQKLHH